MKRLEIEKTLGIQAEEVLAKRHNLWVGISDTSWFNEHLEVIVRWAFVHSCAQLLVVIPGRLWAVNLNHVEKRSRARALRLAFAKEERCRERLKSVQQELSPESGVRVRIISFDDVLTPSYVRQREMLYRAFSEEGSFYERLTDITRDFLAKRGRTVNKERAEAAALYQLQELPMFLGPLRTNGDDMAYAVNVYPGLGKFDQLVRDLIEGVAFPDLTVALEIAAEPSGVVGVALMEEP